MLKNEETFKDERTIKQPLQIHGSYHSSALELLSEHMRIAQMSAEWLGHNICYTLHIKRQSTKDVDIDYDGDERFYVRAVVKALEILGWD